MWSCWLWHTGEELVVDGSKVTDLCRLPRSRCDAFLAVGGLPAGASSPHDSWRLQPASLRCKVFAVWLCPCSASLTNKSELVSVSRREGPRLAPVVRHLRRQRAWWSEHGDGDDGCGDWHGEQPRDRPARAVLPVTGAFTASIELGFQFGFV